jgi:glyoxylase-like metal-dependent hydrolase (beta-lactamase superfamily II)
VLLDSGEAFVGDLAMNMIPLRLTPGLPIFAEQPALLQGSIERLLALGARTIYPAHGPAFPASVLERAAGAGIIDG